MSEQKKWVPPAKVEDVFDKVLGNQFASINAPTAGAREEKELEEGDAPYQLYSLATPNGQKIGIMLEELGVQYDAHTINIMKGEQFTSGFVKVNPNSKIPALLDKSDPSNPVRLFESGSILLHLAEKHGKLLPETPHGRAETINWLMWQMGSGPYFGQFGHFFKYAPRDKIEAIEYGVARYGMEVQRCLSLLDMVLESRQYVAGDEYTIADIAIFPWVRGLDQGYGGRDFLGLDKYNNVTRWVNEISERPAVKRGLVVTKSS